MPRLIRDWATFGATRIWTGTMNEAHGEQQAGGEQQPHSEQQHLRARIRLLSSPREVPRVIGSYGTVSSRCDACDNPIPEGCPQYEIGFSTLTFRLDAQCFGIWMEEMLRDMPPGPKTA